MTAPKSTTEVAEALGIERDRVRQIAKRRGIKAVSRDTVTGEAYWPADRVIEMLPKRRRRNRNDD